MVSIIAWLVNLFIPFQRVSIFVWSMIIFIGFKRHKDDPTFFLSPRLFTKKRNNKKKQKPCIWPATGVHDRFCEHEDFAHASRSHAVYTGSINEACSFFESYSFCARMSPTSCSFTSLVMWARPEASITSVWQFLAHQKEDKGRKCQ